MNAKEYEKSINQYMKTRTPLDVTAVYEILKDRFPLTLTHTFALENGEKDYDGDYTMVCGTSSAGAFQLYDNGLYGVFDVDKADGSYTHWHPCEVAEAVEDVIAFMQGVCKREKVSHFMKLNDAPFSMIKSGQKTIELRLLDEKRQKIQPGDTIVFANNSTGKILVTTVVRLHKFDSFEALYKSLPLLKCGYTEDDVDKADPADMEAYYSVQEQEKYGVVGIELKIP